MIHCLFSTLHFWDIAGLMEASFCTDIFFSREGGGFAEIDAILIPIYSYELSIPPVSEEIRIRLNTGIEMSDVIL